jgi:hypothetical protein
MIVIEIQFEKGLVFPRCQFPMDTRLGNATDGQLDDDELEEIR